MLIFVFYNYSYYTYYKYNTSSVINIKYKMLIYVSFSLIPFLQTTILNNANFILYSILFQFQLKYKRDKILISL